MTEIIRLAHVPAWWRVAERRHVVLLLAVALAVRLVVSPFHGFFYDLQAYVLWGRLLDYNFLHFYSVASSGNVAQLAQHGYLPNYPPLIVYLYGVLDGAYLIVAHLFTSQPVLDVRQSPLLAVYMRAPILVSDLASVWLIYRLAHRIRSHRWALLAAGSYALSPAIFWDGPLWGQTDGLFTLLLILALLQALRHRGLVTGTLLAAAVLIKPQPIVFAPLLLLYLLRWAGLRQASRALIGMVGTALIVCAPYLLPPHPELFTFLRVGASVTLAKPFATIDAMNLWWLVGALHVDALTPYLGPLSPNTLGWILFCTTLAIVAVGIWHDASALRLFAAEAIVAVAFFDLTPFQHDRYIYPALALFLLAAIYHTRYLLYYGVATVTAFINIAMGSLIFASPPAGSPSNPAITLLAASTFLVAGANVWLLAASLLLYSRPGLKMGWCTIAHRRTDPVAPEPIT